MNKIIPTFILLFASFFLPVIVLADTTLEYRMGGFYHTNDRFRDIYGCVGPSYQVEASTCLFPCIDLWANADLFSKHGSVRGCGKSKINIVNLSLGPKWICPLTCCLDLYFGVGVSVARTQLENKLDCSTNNKYNYSVGGVLKSGVDLYLTQCLFLDVFFDYLYQPACFHKTVDIGGFKTGLGIGVRF